MTQGLLLNLKGNVLVVSSLYIHILALIMRMIMFFGLDGNVLVKSGLIKDQYTLPV